MDVLQRACLALLPVISMNTTVPIVGAPENLSKEPFQAGVDFLLI